MSVPLIKISIDGCPLDAIAVDPDGIRDLDDSPTFNRQLLMFEQDYEPSNRPPLSDWAEELEEILQMSMIKKERLKKLLEQIQEYEQKEADKIQIEVEWDETC